MIVLDACAVVALLDDEPAADEVAGMLDDGAALTAVGIGEVFDTQMRGHGKGRKEIAVALSDLGLLDAVVVDEDVGIRAGVLRSIYYRRWRTPLSVADCVAAAIAKSLGATLATSDGHLLDMAYKEGIEVRPLPNSTGDHAWVEPHD